MPSSSLTALVALAALGAAAATDGLSSTVLTAQYRCEGYLCPQWAIDVTRCAPPRALACLVGLYGVGPAASTACVGRNQATASTEGCGCIALYE